MEHKARMNEIKISVTKDFSRRPYGRYEEVHGNASGESFRKKLLIPKLEQAISNDAILVVSLDGYNRYGRSFLDEAFGGLIREENFSYDQIMKHLRVTHSAVKSFESLVLERLQAAKEAVSKR